MSTAVTFNGVGYLIPASGDDNWGDYTSAFLISVAENALARSGGIFELTADTDFGTSFGLKSIYYKSRSANIAASGVLRLANADSIAFRNATNTSDLLLKVNGNALEFNGSSVIDNNSAQVLTNKTIDANNNTLLNIANASIAVNAAIAYSKLALTNSIVDADVASAAAIAGTKVTPAFGSQDISTTGTLAAAASSLTGALNMNSHLINNVTDPVSAQDAATKAYVDSVAQGLDVKASARAANIANVVGVYVGSPTFTLTTASSTLTVDGYAAINGDRILLRAQTTQTQNGIYIVSGVGTAVVLTRSLDANSSSELTSAFVFVQSGSTLADTSWVMSTDPFTIDVSNCVWSQFSGAGTYTASGGIVLTGTNFAIGTSGSDGITNAMINSAAAISRAKIASGTIGQVVINDPSTGLLNSEAQLAITRGGTGQATATAAFDGLSPLTTRGDLLTRDASNNIRLGIGAANTVLTSNATDPSWALILNANIDAAANISRAKLAAGSVGHVVINDPSTGLFSSEARLALSRFATGTSGLPLVAQGAGVDSVYAQLSLATGVTGTLPVANGGTGATLSGLTAEDVILGSSGTALKRLGLGSNNQVLTIVGGLVAWSTGTMTGTNTGDVTAAAFGAAPNGNGFSLAGQVLTLQPADGSNPGGVSILAQIFAGPKTFASNVIVTGELSTKKGADFSTAATSNNVSTSGFSSFRYTGVGAAILTGFANGSDGKYLILINASSDTVTIKNNDSGSLAANRVITGTGSDVVMAAGSSLFFEYDSTAQFWRVIGGSGSATLNSSTVTATGTIGATTDVVLTNASTAITLTLPAVSAGKLIRIKDIAGSASSFNVTLLRAGSALIDGQTNLVITQNYQAINLFSDGTNWHAV